AKLNHDLIRDGQHKIMVEFYKKLIQLRKETPSLTCLNKDIQQVKGFADNGLLYLRRWSEDSQAMMVFNISGDPISSTLPVPAGKWHKKLDSAEELWAGGGSTVPHQLSLKGEVTVALSPWAFILFIKEV
ncbi:DUF3459 domain-containing protein, partial [Chloroflexota bacterium]